MRTLHVPQRILGILPIRLIFYVEISLVNMVHIYRHTVFEITYVCLLISFYYDTKLQMARFNNIFQKVYKINQR